MAGFKEFLAESASSYPWDKYRKVADKMDGRRKDQYLKAIDAFEDGINNKHIWNADFKDHYSYGFSRGLDEVWDTFPDHYSDTFEYSLFAVNSIAKLIRISKGKEVSAGAKEFLSNVETLPAMIKELKTYIEKGRRVSDEQKAVNAKAAKDWSAAVSHDDSKKVIATLEKLVADIRVQYENQFADMWYKRVEDAYKQKDELSVKRGPRNWYHGIKDQTTLQLLYRSVDLSGKDAILLPDWKTKVKKMADDAVRQILDGFIFKNKKKLAAIVSKKNNLKDIRIVYNRLNNYNLDNEIALEFKDGAKFNVYSKTIWKSSKRGLIFTQYPTRFANVINSDGSTMSAPTEEKMNTSFK